MKTTPSGPCAPAWAWSRPGQSERDWCVATVCAWPCGSASIPGSWWWTRWRRRPAGAPGTGCDTQPGRPAPGAGSPRHVVIMYTTHQLVQGLFTCRPWSPPPSQGWTSRSRLSGAGRQPGAESLRGGQSRTPDAPGGAEEELGLLRRRWTQVQEGDGQVVLLSGEAGIGKSRLVRELYEAVGSDQATRLVFRCASRLSRAPCTRSSSTSSGWAGEGRRRREAQCVRLEQALRRVSVPVQRCCRCWRPCCRCPIPLAIHLAVQSRAAEAEDPGSAHRLALAARRSSRCSWCGKTCTGPTPRRWSCSACSWIRCPRCVS